MQERHNSSVIAMELHLSCTNPSIYVWDQNLVIPVPEDALAPNGARPSAGTVLTTKLDIFSFQVSLAVSDVVQLFINQMTPFR